MPSVRVFCGGAKVRGAQRTTDFFLDVSARRSERANVTLRVHEITSRMLTDLPPRIADLLEIATYVYCADQLVRRDAETMPRMGVGWRRSFEFSIGVRDPEFWGSASITNLLVATLEFLSDDAYRFAFSQVRSLGGDQAFLELGADGPSSGFTPDEIILFSGGLDSFAGALHSILGKSFNVALVSHRSSPMIAGKQTALVQAIKERAGSGRLLYVTVGVTVGNNRAVEFTQRTRSFLFAALGFVVTHLLGRKQVSFYENGVVSLNLPLAEHVLGTRATRTTHPRILKSFTALFTRVGAQNFRVENPFFWKTKADVVRVIADLGCGDLIPATFSSASVRSATRQSGRHCGRCSQCLDRRFGVLAADCGHFEPEEVYSIDLFRGAREPGIDAITAESYVLATHRYAGSTEAGFLGTHAEVLRAVRYLDMPRAEALTRLHELHVRHGQAVKAVLSQQVRTIDLIASRLSLPDSSLLAMVVGSQVQTITYNDPTESEPSANDQAALRPVPSNIQLISFAVTDGGKRIIFSGGPALRGASAKVISTLLTNFKAGLAADRGADGYAYMSDMQLAEALEIKVEGLRQRIHRLRSDLRDQFLTQVNVAIEEHDVVENFPWKGYRLNPHLSLAPMLVNRGAVSRASE